MSKRVESQLDVGQLRDGERLDPAQDHLHLLNCLVLLHLTEYITQGVQGLAVVSLSVVLFFDFFGDEFEYLREEHIVVLNDLYTFLRVLELFPDMFGSSCMSIVSIMIVLVISHLLAVHIAHEVRDMHLLRPILQIQTQIHYLHLS